MEKVPVLDMLKTVARSMFSRPACKMYPVKKQVLYKNTRGHVEVDPAKCILCMLCMKRCPVEALVVDREKATWQIDRLKCITCGLCVEVCPTQALSMANTYIPPSDAEVKETIDIEIAAGR